jgi:SulP family sulfate permease
VNQRLSRRSVLVPKLVTELPSYDRNAFLRDAIAGVVVGIVALPLCIAFAIASGVTPDRGLWTGIVAGFLISLLGGSKVQVGGPTGAFVVIVYGIVQKYGVDGLTVATFMAGFILVAFGVFKFGGAIKFIPYPVTMGFTSGIAVIIATGQVKDFLGLHMGAIPADFMEKLGAYAANVGGFTPAAVGVSLLTLAIIILWPRVTTRVPSPFVGLIVATVLVQIFHIPVETIGSRFGDVTAAIPHPQIPHVTLAQATALIGPAFTIAMLGAIESLLSAVVSDGMIGARHRSNMELVAQGVANLASPLVGGIPATGAIARTATNVKNGGRTPVAGIIHALTLLVITLVAGRWAGLIPMASLAAILMVVAYGMSEWRAFVTELRSQKSDVAVLLATFLLTVFVDLTVAIEVGMVLAAFLFIQRMASVANVSAVTRELEDDINGDVADPGDVRFRKVPPGVEVYEITGPFFFGAAEVFKDTLAQIVGKPKVLIIRMRNVLTIDSTGMHALRDVVRRSRKEGTAVLLSDVHAKVIVTMEGSPLQEDLGADALFDNIDRALDRARAIVDAAKR